MTSSRRWLATAASGSATIVLVARLSASPASRPSAASSLFSDDSIAASNGAIPLSRSERRPSSSAAPSAGVSRSGRVRRCARSTNTRPSSTETSRYSPGSPSGGPTADSSSRSASSSSRSAPTILASWSTATPSGCLATYGTMYSSRRSFCETSRIVASRAARAAGQDRIRAARDGERTGVSRGDCRAVAVVREGAMLVGPGAPVGLVVEHRVVRLDRVELVVDPRAQPVAAEQPDRALGREDPGRGELEVAAVERDQRAVAVDPLDRGQPEVLVADLGGLGRERELDLLGRLGLERPRRALGERLDVEVGGALEVRRLGLGRHHRILDAIDPERADLLAQV